MEGFFLEREEGNGQTGKALGLVISGAPPLELLEWYAISKVSPCRSFSRPEVTSARPPKEQRVGLKKSLNGKVLDQLPFEILL